jgi:uncharacterized protein (DUF302 family)
MSYALSTTVVRDFTETLEATRAALVEQGFGVLTEIDLSATLKEKIGADVPPQVILGACRPPLAYAAVQAEPSIGLLLPCNVVVRDTGDGATVVEAVDPSVMETLTHNDKLADVAADARQRLQSALDSLTA